MSAFPTANAPAEEEDITITAVISGRGPFSGSEFQANLSAENLRGLAKSFGRPAKDCKIWSAWKRRVVKDYRLKFKHALRKLKRNPN